MACGRKISWILLVMVAATLLLEAQSQETWMQWINRQYDVFRRGFTEGLRRTGSSSRRSIVATKQSFTRSTQNSTKTTQPLGNSLRVNSRYFNSKFQEPVPDSTPFPCNVEAGDPGTRSNSRPNSVHELRPGDIDIIGAMGDSLTAANGAAAASMAEVYIENRGMSWSGGGESTWREYLTLPNILKEFNPNLVGYAAKDSLGSQKSSQFNVAEPMGISDDMPFQAKLLVKRIRSDLRVNFEHDWKMVTLMIGSNDYCSHMCYLKKYSSLLDIHKKDILKALDYLQDNLPRTIVNLVGPPHLRILQEFIGRSTICYLINEVECPCLFGLRWQHLKMNFSEIMERVQEIEFEVVQSGRYNIKDDFTVVYHPFLTQAQIPTKRTAKGDIITDFSYLSEDCFHFSQKTQAVAGNSLWNSLLEPVGNKSTSAVDAPFSRFLCPSAENPYIYTDKNSNT